MITAWLVASLLVLLAVPAARGLTTVPRHAARFDVGRPQRGQLAPDYASLLDAIARQVRSGSSLTSAVIDEIATSSSLAVVVDRLAAGDSLPHALDATDRDDADLAFTVQALSATAHLGGHIAATLDQAAAVLRERAAARAERRAHAAQARLSGRAPTIVPLGFAMWSAAASQRTRDVYVSTGAGGICVLFRNRSQPRRLALDETHRRAGLMLAVGSAMVVALIGWRFSPRATVRGSTRRWPVRRWPWVVLAGAAVFVSPFLGVVMVIGGGLWRHLAGTRRTARSARQTAAAFPDALDLLVLSIRAGYLPAQAIIEVVPFLSQPLRPAFIEVAEAMRQGERFADALGHLQARLGQVAQPLVDSLSAADRYGLPLAPVLERLALEARHQRRRDAEAAARELPVRLAMPLVLCTLPSFVLLAIIPLLLGALSSLHT